MDCKGLTKAGEPCKRQASDDSEYCAAHQPEKAEPTKKLVKVRARGRFIDGGLRAQFEAEDIRLDWPRGEVRTISYELYKLCLKSGARFELE